MHTLVHSPVRHSLELDDTIEVESSSVMVLCVEDIIVGEFEALFLTENDNLQAFYSN